MQGFKIKILSWNERGWSAQQKCRLIKKTINQAKPDVILLEVTKKTMISRQELGKIWGLRFKEWVFLPSFGASRGILVAWDSRLVKIFQSFIADYSVLVLIEDTDGCKWWLSGIYGLASASERQNF